MRHCCDIAIKHPSPGERSICTRYATKNAKQKYIKPCNDFNFIDIDACNMKLIDAWITLIKWDNPSPELHQKPFNDFLIQTLLPTPLTLNLVQTHSLNSQHSKRP